MKNVESEIFDAEDLPAIDDGKPAESVTAITRTMPVADMEEQTLLLEKAVSVAPRYMAAFNTMLCTATFAEDWTQFGEGEKAKMCLGADGAMRIVSRCNFPIEFYDVGFKKETVTYEGYEGYRYIFEGFARLGCRSVHAIGQYSTREAFLGKRSGEWKTEEEINESHIRKGAHTYFKSAAIKDLLGIRNIPVDEFDKMAIASKKDPKKATSVKHNTGGQGGVSDGARELQNELNELLGRIAAVSLVVLFDDETGENVIGEVPQKVVDYIAEGHDNITTLTSYSLKALTTWVSKGKGNQADKKIDGHTNLQKIKEPQLKVLLRKTKKMMKDAGVE
jgi:hypothetical protein